MHCCILNKNIFFCIYKLNSNVYSHQMLYCYQLVYMHNVRLFIIENKINTRISYRYLTYLTKRENIGAHLLIKRRHNTSFTA